MNTKGGTLALIAHDNKKSELAAWAVKHIEELKKFRIIATGTTGKLLEESTDLKVHKMESGPMGGDLQIGAELVEGSVAAIFFLWDPLSPHPHDVDVKALLRIAVLYNVPLACNFSTCDAVLEWLAAGGHLTQAPRKS